MNIVNRDMSEAEKAKIKRSKENIASLIKELESGSVFLEDIGEDKVERLLSLLKGKEE